MILSKNPITDNVVRTARTRGVLRAIRLRSESLRWRYNHNSMIVRAIRLILTCSCKSCTTNRLADRHSTLPRPLLDCFPHDGPHVRATGHQPCEPRDARAPCRDDEPCARRDKRTRRASENLHVESVVRGAATCIGVGASSEVGPSSEQARPIRGTVAVAGRLTRGRVGGRRGSGRRWDAAARDLVRSPAPPRRAPELGGPGGGGRAGHVSPSPGPGVRSWAYLVGLHFRLSCTGYGLPS